MKIIFDRQKIINEIAPLMCAVSGKATITATEGILMEATAPDTCVMTTFDLEKGVQLTIHARVEEEGKFIINAQKFLQTMRVMDSDEVTLTVDERRMAAIVNESGSSSYKMIALPPEDFPELPRLLTERGFVISQKTFKKMLGKVSHAIGVNDQRPVLNGCYFMIEGDRMEVVSCDSFKLAKCISTVELENKNKDGSPLHFAFNIPVKTVGEMQRMLSDDEEDTVLIYVSRKNIMLNLEDRIFFSRLIDGPYIDYDRIIMKNHKITVDLGKDAFISALERAALVTEERIAGSLRSYVKLELSGDRMKISAVSTVGSTYEELPIEHEGEDLVIAFNNRYLIDSIRASDAERIRISLSTPLASINIEPAPDDTAANGEELFMLLPVRMKE